MRCFSIALAMIGLALWGCNSQPKPGEPNGQRQDLERIRQACMASDYSYDQVKAVVAFGPRLVGTKALDQAQLHVEQEMQKLGLQTTREEVRTPGWRRGREELRVTSGDGFQANQALGATTLTGCSSTGPTSIKAPLVVVTSLDELDEQEVRGKIVLFHAPFDDPSARAGKGLKAYSDTVQFRNLGPAAGSRLGAVAVLVSSAGSGGVPHCGETLFESGEKPIPAAALSNEEADRLALAAQKGQVRLELRLTPENLPASQGWNVVADWKGKGHPEQIVLVSGHVDSWDLSAGATDNACGLAMAMETIQVLKKLNLQPDRTIRFVSWTSEEYTQAGAAAYWQKHSGDQHYAAIESDLGGGAPVRLDLACDDSERAGDLLKQLAPLGQFLRADGVTEVRQAKTTRPDLRPFLQGGVACYSPIQDTRDFFQYHHTIHDTLDKVKPEALKQNCAVTAALTYFLSQP